MVGEKIEWFVVDGIGRIIIGDFERVVVLMVELGDYVVDEREFDDGVNYKESDCDF